jgi:hypothetical protein
MGAKMFTLRQSSDWFLGTSAAWQGGRGGEGVRRAFCGCERAARRSLTVVVRLSAARAPVAAVQDIVPWTPGLRRKPLVCPVRACRKGHSQELTHVTRYLSAKHAPLLKRYNVVLAGNKASEDDASEDEHKHGTPRVWQPDCVCVCVCKVPWCVQSLQCVCVVPLRVSPCVCVCLKKKNQATINPLCASVPLDLCATVPVAHPAAHRPWTLDAASRRLQQGGARSPPPGFYASLKVCI